MVSKYKRKYFAKGPKGPSVYNGPQGQAVIMLAYVTQPSYGYTATVYLNGNAVYTSRKPQCMALAMRRASRQAQKACGIVVAKTTSKPTTVTHTTVTNGGKVYHILQ